MGAVEIRLGRAGSGKSTRIAEEIERELMARPIGSRIFWLVPSENTYAAERLLMKKIPSSLRAEVLNLRRLAQRAVPAAAPLGKTLNASGRRLLLAAVYQQTLPRLQVLRRDRLTISFLDSILDAFTELSDNLVPIGQLEGALESAATRIEDLPGGSARAGRSLLGNRADLSYLYIKWKQALEERGFADSGELLNRVQPYLLNWQELQGATVYVDGFADLTRQELNFLLDVAEAAEQTIVSLSMDSAWLKGAGAAVAGGQSVAVAGGQPVAGPNAGGVAGAAAQVDLFARQAAQFGALSTAEAPGLQELLARVSAPGSVYAPQTLALYDALSLACLQRGLALTTVSGSGVTPSHTAPAAPAPVFGVTPEFSRFAHAEDLALIERRLYEDPMATGGPASTGGTGGTGGTRATAREAKVAAHRVHFAAAQNPRAEADGVAQEISRLVREEGFRYPDIVVMVPDLEAYGAYIKDSFAAYEIPHYMDVFPPFGNHPLAKFLLSALQIVADEFGTEALIRLLKSDFCGLPRADADWLETYLRRYEVTGEQAWLGAKAWQFASLRANAVQSTRARGEDERADELRQKMAAYLGPFAKRLKPSSLAPRNLSLALWELLKSADAKPIVAAWMINDDQALSPMEASMHEQAWQLTMGLLNDLAGLTIEGDEELPRSFLFEIVNSEILSQTLSTIPAGLGDVLVTEVQRTNALDCEVTFLLGMTDGVVPRKVESQGLIQDEERLQFERLFGWRLGYTTEELQLCERATAYVALTRAKSLVQLSYPLADGAGKGVSPSLLLSRLRNLFDPATTTEVLWTNKGEDETQSASERTLWAPQTAMNVLLRSLRAVREEGRVHPFARLFFDWALSHSDERAGQVRTALAGLIHHTSASRFTPALAQNLFGLPLAMTVYQLESFAACPFQHFLQFGLKIETDDSPEVTQTAKGRLLHDAVLQFVQAQMQQVERWRELSDVEAVRLMGTMFEQLLQQPSNANWLERAVRREQAQEVEHVLETAAKVLVRHIRYGKFVPAALELSFGGALRGESGPQLPGMDLTTAKGYPVQLRGRIDRVDVAPEVFAAGAAGLTGGAVGHGSSDAASRGTPQAAYRIIDYKSSKRDIDFSQVEHGLSLQLPIYAAVVQKYFQDVFGLAGQAAGILYLPVYQELSTNWVPDDPDLATRAAVKRMRARGLLVSERESIEAMDRRLVEGEESDLFGKVYNKDGRLAKTATVVARNEWDGVIDRALTHARQFSDRILEGEIEISPAHMEGKQPACAYCPYASVCQLDRRLDTALVRRLARQDKASLLAAWTIDDGKGDEELA